MTETVAKRQSTFRARCRRGRWHKRGGDIMTVNLETGRSRGAVAGRGAQRTTADVPGHGPPSAALAQIVTSGLAAQAVSVAAELGVADLLADGSRSVDELAQQTG